MIVLVRAYSFGCIFDDRNVVVFVDVQQVVYFVQVVIEVCGDDCFCVWCDGCFYECWVQVLCVWQDVDKYGCCVYVGDG